jgi:chitinase
LNDTCASTKSGSADSAVQAWTSAGFPADQIVLGGASYGHSFHVNPSDAFDDSGNLNVNAAFDKNQQPHGDSQVGDAGIDQCANAVPVGAVFNFWGLNNDGTAAQGINYTFDECSQTPFVYNSTSNVMISFDATSFKAKGNLLAIWVWLDLRCGMYYLVSLMVFCWIQFVAGWAMFEGWTNRRE